jgi:hypothetical protein
MMLISVMGIISFEQRVVDRGVVFSHLGRGKYH